MRYRWKRYWDDRPGLRRLCIGVLMGLCAVAVTIMLLLAWNQDRHYDQLSDIHTQVEEYEREIDRLRLELIEAQAQITAESMEPTVLVAFYTNDPSRVPTDRKFSPILISEEPVETELEAVSYLDAFPGSAALVPPGDTTLIQAVQMQELGYSVILGYADNCTSGQENGITYLSYNLVRVAEYDITTYLSKLAVSELPLVFVFHLEDLPEAVVEEDLAWIQKWVDSGRIRYGTIADTVEAFTARRTAEETRREEYALYEAQVNARIEELQQRIRDAYADWNRAHPEK